MAATKKSAGRDVAPPGRTRVCPHCKSRILESADICPACQHHLRFGPRSERHAARKFSAFHVEGTFKHPTDAATCEYSVVISVGGEGQKIKRHVIDVGAVEPDELRTFDLSVEVSTPRR